MNDRMKQFMKDLKEFDIEGIYDMFLYDFFEESQVQHHLTEIEYNNPHFHFEDKLPALFEGVLPHKTNRDYYRFVINKIKNDNSDISNYYKFFDIIADIKKLSDDEIEHIINETVTDEHTLDLSFLADLSSSDSDIIKNLKMGDKVYIYHNYDRTKRQIGELGGIVLFMDDYYNKENKIVYNIMNRHQNMGIPLDKLVYDEIVEKIDTLPLSLKLEDVMMYKGEDNIFLKQNKRIYDTVENEILDDNTCYVIKTEHLVYVVVHPLAANILFLNNIELYNNLFDKVTIQMKVNELKGVREMTYDFGVIETVTINGVSYQIHKFLRRTYESDNENINRVYQNKMKKIIKEVDKTSITLDIG